MRNVGTWGKGWWRYPVAVTALLIAGCASTNSGDSAILGNGDEVTASDPARFTHSGFLSDYARLHPATWAQGIQCWQESGLNAKKYDKVLITPISVRLKPSQEKAIAPTELAALSNYFHQALVKAIEPQMQVVDKPGPGVLVIRIALTDLVPTGVPESVAGSLVPYGFVAEVGSGVATGRPAGSTPYLGETGMEMQLRNGNTDRILGECRDTEIGRKYAADANGSAEGAAQTWASGYLGSFEKWSYAKDAFDKWAALTAQHLAALHRTTSSR
jgi:hypothetical protein